MPLNTGNMGGVGDFVKALTGRSAIRQQAEADAWRRADDIGRARKAAAEAGIAEDKLAQLPRIADAIVKAAGGTVTPEQAAGLATLGRGGLANYSQMAEGQSQFFDLGQTQKAAAMVDAGNPDSAKVNQVLSVRQRGGALLTPQTVNPQGLADTMLAKERAQAQSYLANADAASRRAAAYEYGVRARAQSALQPRSSPNAAGAGTLGGDAMELFKVVPPRSPPGTPRVFDQARYERFLSDWMLAGGKGNINDAARAWVAAPLVQAELESKARKMPVQIVDPTKPASMRVSPSAPYKTPPAAHIQMLKANPNLRGYFDETYGPGASDRVLGGN